MTGRSARTGCVLLAAALVALVVSAASLASIPKLKDSLIVPNKSVGPLKLKVSYKTAIKEIGTTKGGNCTPGTSCQFGSVKSGLLSFTVTSLSTDGSPYVAVITITAPTESSKGKPGHFYTGPLMKLTTSKKIGLGSTAKALTKAYPHLKKTSIGGANYVYVIEGSGPADERPQTNFIVEDKHVVTISTQAIPLG